MKILLANPFVKYKINNKYEKYYIRSGSRWPHTGIKAAGTIPHYLPFPFFLAYSASLLKNKGFEVHVLDAVAMDLSEEEFLKRIENIKPHLIFYEVTTPTSRYDLALAVKLKKMFPGIVVILGGPHATTFSYQILKDTNAVDFVLKGEYEFSLLGLAESIEDDKDSFPAGVVYKEKDKIIDNGRIPLIEPLDLLPPPARDIFPSNDYSNPTIYWDGFCQSFPAIQMHSSRGCPYRCYFCLWNQVIYDNGRYRTFTPNRVVDEMEEAVYKYRAREVYFDDDDFTISSAHVNGICDEIIKRRLSVKWSCMADAINLNEQIIKKMTQSGCIGLKFGVESGSSRILQNVGKTVNLEKVNEIVRLCERFDIKSHATFTLGLLGETMEDVKETMGFAQSLCVDSIQVSIATPFPGTEFFNIAEKEGFLRTKDWMLYDGKASEVVSYPSLDWKGVEKIRRNGLRNWFLRILFSPSRLLRQFHLFIRTLKGIGGRLFIEKLVSVIIDESKNR